LLPGSTGIQVMSYLGYKLIGKPNIKGPLMSGIAVVAFLVGAFLPVSTALIVVAAGLLGILLFSTSVTKPQTEGGRR
jgi:hypothetical protein